ncbi:MAG TPA: hypothetical protein VF885_02995 [Arthrobacter sp.]
MSSSAASARPYRVHLDVLTFTGSYWNPQLSTLRWADRSLTVEQISALTGDAAHDRLLKALSYPLRKTVVWWGAATAALILAGWLVPGLGCAAPAAVWAFGTGILALLQARRWKFIDAARHRIEYAAKAAAASGAMERIPVISPHWTPLRRIEVALATLQQYGTDIDDRARAAVNAVLTPPAPEPPPSPAGTNPKTRRRAALQSVFNDLLRREPPPPTAAELIAALEADAARHR